MMSFLTRGKSPMILSVMAYSVTAGIQLLLNKLILHHLPYPSLLVSSQMVATLIFIYAVKRVGYLKVDEIQKEQLVPYIYYSIIFCVTVYSNIASLAVTDVETLLVFRALTPCLVAVFDAKYLGREYPTNRSWGGMILILLGAFAYTYVQESYRAEKKLGILGLFWPSVYMVAMSAEMAYGRRIIKVVDLKTRSGPVFYSNLLCFTPLLVFAAMHKEYQQVITDRAEGKLTLDFGIFCLLMLGFVAAIATGYTTWWCRDKVSATSFTVIGVLTMCLTMPLHVQDYYVYWQKQHQDEAPLPTTPAGLFFIFFSLVGGTCLYEPAPLRPLTTSSKLVAAQADDIWNVTSLDDELNYMDESASLILQRRPLL